jgi:hypothetical protein
MSERSTIRKGRPEAGIALLISIFALLLISVIAIALIVSSGTESSLAGNYRSATGVYYAALAGLEEARGRLLTKNPDSFKNTDAAFLPPAGTTLALGLVRYVTNPVGTEDVLAAYPDKEYAAEFGSDPVTANVKTTPSIWNRSPLNTLPFPGPLYKWVRINAVSEVSLNVDTFPFDAIKDATPVYYDGIHLTDNNSWPQVLEITALAVLPNSSQKLLQYLVAPGRIQLPPFLAALTLSGSAGNGAAYHAPASNTSYAVKGDDYDCSDPPVPTGVNPHVAIGVFTDTDKTSVINGIPSSPPSVRTSYTGSGSAPDVENLNMTSPSFPASLQTPSQLDALAQSIAQSSDVTIPSGPITYPLPTFTQADLTPLGMAPNNPLTVVVNGNLDVSSWTGTGYGLLLVIGKFTYDPSSTWNGIVLVIGQGQVDGSHLDYKQINGAMLVAKTRDPAGSLLPDPNLGGASVQFTDSMQGNGIRYNSCWIQKAQPTGSYKILSFHEISQQ